MRSTRDQLFLRCHHCSLSAISRPASRQGCSGGTSNSLNVILESLTRYAARGMSLKLAHYTPSTQFSRPMSGILFQTSGKSRYKSKSGCLNAVEDERRDMERDNKGQLGCWVVDFNGESGRGYFLWSPITLTLFLSILDSDVQLSCIKRQRPLRNPAAFVDTSSSEHVRERKNMPKKTIGGRRPHR